MNWLSFISIFIVCEGRGITYYNVGYVPVVVVVRLPRPMEGNGILIGYVPDGLIRLFQVAACDLLCSSVGELCGGSLREERLDVLERVLTQRHIHQPQLEWYS